MRRQSIGCASFPLPAQDKRLKKRRIYFFYIYKLSDLFEDSGADPTKKDPRRPFSPTPSLKHWILLISILWTESTMVHDANSVIKKKGHSGSLSRALRLGVRWIEARFKKRVSKVIYTYSLHNTYL